MPKCECFQGYFGTYCDVSGKELPQLKTIARTILDDVLAYVNGKKLEQFDVEIIANVVRALVNHPDVVSDLQYYKVLQLLEILSAGDVYVH